MGWKRGFLVAVIILISGCNLSTKSEQPTPTHIAPPQVVNVTATTVALTPEEEVEEVTEIAELLSSTPSPTSTPDDTATPAPPTATTVPVVAPPTDLRPTVTPSNTPAPTATLTATPALTGQVAEGRTGLRLRSAPDRNATILSNLNEFTELTIYERTSDNVWLRVDTENGQSGWIMTEFVELYVSLDAIPVSSMAVQAATQAPPVAQAETEVAANFYSDGIVHAEGNGLRMRSLPSTNADIVMVLPEQAPVEIVGRNQDNSWLQITASQGQTGWVYAAYIQTSMNIAALPIPPDAYEPTPVAFVAPAAPGSSGAISGISSNAVQIFLRGQSLGNRPNVFSKVGDSITVATPFLFPFSWGYANLRNYAYYEPVLGYFSGTTARDSNSFGNTSLAAGNGWSTRTVLDPGVAAAGVCNPGETPLACEYRVVRPSIALIMIGTNDVAGVPASEYQGNLQRIVQISIDMGVIPILSTIPARNGLDGTVAQFNQIIIATARSYDVPLWDYGSAMTNLPRLGLADDGVHPSWPPGGGTQFSAAVDFTDENLQYGFTLRNLMALQVLDAIWRQVIAPNEGSTYVPPAASAPPAVPAATSGSTASNCPGAPASRLTVGQQGRVTSGSANNVRSEPSLSAVLLGRIPGEGVFTILAGPTCSDGINYWQVDYNGLIGWTG